MNADTQPHESESLPVHVAACAERYKTLFNRLSRIEWILIATAGALITGLFTAVWKLSQLVALAGG